MFQRFRVTLTVNGELHSVLVHPMARLLDVIRQELDLTGTKEGCGEGECGACSVFLNGELVNSCLVPALQVDGGELITIEGISRDSRWQRLQRSFVLHGGAQCGICTPGMILAAANLLQRIPNPAEAEIRQGFGRQSLSVHRVCKDTGRSVSSCESHDGRIVSRHLPPI